MCNQLPWSDARAEYDGTWADDIEIRPRQGGKSTAIARAMAISETVQIRPERAEIAAIMERAMTAPGARYADGGVVLGFPTPGLPEVRMTPGEYVLKAEEVRRMGFDARIRATLDEMVQELEPEPFDDFPDPPTIDPF